VFLGVKDGPPYPPIQILLVLLWSISDEELGLGRGRTLGVHVVEVEVVGGGDDALHARIEIVGRVDHGEVGSGGHGGVVGAVAVAVAVTVTVAVVVGVGYVAGFLAALVLNVSEFVVVLICAARYVSLAGVLAGVDGVAMTVAESAGDAGVVRSSVVSTLLFVVVCLGRVGGRGGVLGRFPAIAMCVAVVEEHALVLLEDVRRGSNVVVFQRLEIGEGVVLGR
jgi:hypothetical protein